MKEIGHALATAVLEIAEQQHSRVLQWKSTPNGVILAADGDPDDHGAGAIAAAESIEAETCSECRGPGRPYGTTRDGPARIRCAECAAPGEIPVDTEWTIPANAVMTPAEAAARGYGDPDRRKTVRCCGWSVQHVTRLMNRIPTEAEFIHHYGWNHLARALLRLALGSQEPERWRLTDVKEKWGCISAGCDPWSPWRSGALHLFFKVGSKTCSRCGRPGTLRDHCEDSFGVLPLCDACEAQFQEDRKTPNGLIDRIISEHAARRALEAERGSEPPRPANRPAPNTER